MRGTIVAAVLAGLLAPSFGAVAAETKKAMWTAYVTWRYQPPMESAPYAPYRLFLGEATGFDIRNNGDASFPDTMTFRCFGLFRVMDRNWSGEGSCFKSDKAGDMIVYNFTPDGKFTLDGGTGKYKGIHGDGATRVLWERDLAGGDWAAVIQHEATWRIE